MRSKQDPPPVNFQSAKNAWVQRAARVATPALLHHEVALVLTFYLDLELRVRLVGLQSAAHLNGLQGAIEGIDVGSDRLLTRLDKGKEVKVKA